MENWQILILGIVITGMLGCSDSAYDLKEFYPLDQGNSWTYLVTKGDEPFEQTLRIDGREIINSIETVRVFFSEDTYKCLAIAPVGIVKYKEFEKDIYEIFNPPAMILPNIKIGEEKNYSSSYTAYNTENVKIGRAAGVFRFKLASIEDVEVPAGRFTGCRRYDYFDRWEAEDGKYDTANCSIWFARGVGKVKEVGRNMEYDPEIKKEKEEIEIHELLSAVVGRSKIGSP